MKIKDQKIKYFFYPTLFNPIMYLLGLICFLWCLFWGWWCINKRRGYTEVKVNGEWRKNWRDFSELALMVVVNTIWCEVRVAEAYAEYIVHLCFSLPTKNKQEVMDFTDRLNHLWWTYTRYRFLDMVYMENEILPDFIMRVCPMRYLAIERVVIAYVESYDENFDSLFSVDKDILNQIVLMYCESQVGIELRAKTLKDIQLVLYRLEENSVPWLVRKLNPKYIKPLPLNAKYYNP